MSRTLYLADFFIFTVFSSDSTLSIFVVSSDQCVSLSKIGYTYMFLDLKLVTIRFRMQMKQRVVRIGDLAKPGSGKRSKVKVRVIA